jgi:hypothetical protein
MNEWGIANIYHVLMITINNISIAIILFNIIYHEC